MVKRLFTILNQLNGSDMLEKKIIKGVTEVIFI